MNGTLTEFRCGIDIGSTTAKVVLTAGKTRDPADALIAEYRRHDARVAETLIDILAPVRKLIGDSPMQVRVTGSAGMGVAERLGLPFVQEVVAAAEVAQGLDRPVRTLVDIGGEDSKLVLFDERGRADIRMNGNCAGGTGAFIDQMAALLDVPLGELDALARQHTRIHGIASRCGVFAKTDVQNLLARSVSKADVAASVFHAVALQTITALSRGATPRPGVVMTGGPLTFLPLLGEMVLDRLGFAPADVVRVHQAELFTAFGAAMSESATGGHVTVTGLLARLRDPATANAPLSQREAPLFRDDAEREAWLAKRFVRIDRVALAELDGQPAFLGIDSGSTTTKMVLTDARGRIALERYAYNRGDHIASVQDGLRELDERLTAAGVAPVIAGSAATGYGEDLIRNVFGLAHGLVETIAHLRAAREVAADVSFVLDIGGQDMKAMFVEGDTIGRIEINEACSSGCGTFLQTFAEVLGMSVDRFATLACEAQAPCRLGSRCTVFMNSRVKQFLREGASVADIAAGLAWSVVRNCLEKVLRIHDMDVLGASIVVQGGTFLNPSVHRAFEKLTGRKVTCPDVAGVIGAWGAALVAMDRYALAQAACDDATAASIRVATPGADTPLAAVHTLSSLSEVGACRKREFVCGGCENQCAVTSLKFPGRKAYFSGNRCERIQSNHGVGVAPGRNLTERREQLLFEGLQASSAGVGDAGTTTRKRTVQLGQARDATTARGGKRLGLPRALNLFENLPFWRALLDHLDFEVVLSAPSSASLYQKGSSSIMSDSICLPAKLVHGHILDLIDQRVDAIFYPQVVYEAPEGDALNSFNCPIVTGYPEVIRSAIDPQARHGIPLIDPIITFRNVRLLELALRRVLVPLGADPSRLHAGIELGFEVMARTRTRQLAEGRRLLERAGREGRRVIVLVGRPYHLDRFINHGIPQMLTEMGVDVMTADFLPVKGNLDGLQVLTQWAYPNRLYHAAREAARYPHVEVVQLNSFGCGPDALASDELAGTLREGGKTLSVVRIDETASPGSIRLRLRTLIETLANRPLRHEVGEPRQRPPIFTDADRDRVLLGPSFFPALEHHIEDEFAAQGYRCEVLPPPDEESLAYGLKHVNNEVCYPAILIAGDMLRALDSDRWKTERPGIVITQTGGQCRASCYASLLGKALISAGHTDVPIATMHLGGNDMHEQPGFQLDRLALVRRGFPTIVVSDCLAMMERALLVRELERGSASALVAEFTARWRALPRKSQATALRLLTEAALAFAAVPARTGTFPRVGVVGEIYVKYVNFANSNVARWLTDQGIEVVVPNLTTFFLQSVVNIQADVEAGIEPADAKWLVARLLDRRTDVFLRRLNRALAPFPYGVPLSRPRELATRAQEVLSLTNQYGEGWLIAGEMLELADHGVENILCLQPFGCIANQVVAKGVERRVRAQHPGLNVLFADMDHNTSEVNLFNRLHFLVRSARATLADGPTPRAVPAAAPSAWRPGNVGARLQGAAETVSDLARESGRGLLSMARTRMAARRAGTPREG